MNDRLLEITKQYLNAILDEIMKQGTEYKELYDKQSDFVKTMFFGTIYSSKEVLEEMFRKAEETEKEFLKMNTETN